MAAMMCILGSLAGFVAALTGFMFFGFSFFAALAIWALSGPVSALFGLGLSVMMQPPVPAEAQPEAA